MAIFKKSFVNLWLNYRIMDILVIIILVALLIIVSLFMWKRNVTLQREKELAVSNHDITKKELEEARLENVALTTRYEEQQKRIEELRGSDGEQEKRLKELFENISYKILDESRVKMGEIGAEHIKTLIKPLGENIDKFRSRVEEVHNEQTKERFSLEREIKRLVDANQRISDEATNLTNALKGSNKVQGDWGEMILERILESSGLVYGSEGYELQNMLRDSSGRAIRNDSGKKLIPDAIVHFPDNRNVIIDSKVSLVSYLNYCNAEDKEQQAIELKRHIASVKNHVSELDIKSYENYVNGSLDFVMMFIPNESAYLLAMNNAPSLWNEAYKKKVLIISPTNLITSLKIVADLWTREKQNKNIEDIVARGEKLYEKCTSFLDAIVKIDSGLKSASTAYENAEKLLKGNGGVIRQAEMLMELGIKSKKRLAISSDEKIELEEENK